MTKLRNSFPASQRRRSRRSLVRAGFAALSLTCTACSAAASDAGLTAATSITSPADIGAGLRSSSNISATEYATGLADVAALAFDDEGQLWVATANYADDGTDGIYLVTASGAAPIEVVDDIVTPLGLLWIGDELFVSSAATVQAYSGFDGTSFSSVRTVVALASDVGEVNGLALSPSGRIVLGVSSPCDSCTNENPDSAAILSFLPDGTDLRVYASDVRAAVGLAFYPGTDTLFVTMNQRDDLGDATPGDWLAVVTDGQSWGFPACYGQGGAACSDQPTPVATLDAHAAVSGVAIVTGQLGTDVGTAAIVAEWATGTLESVSLDPSSPSSASTSTDFVTGLSNPVAVVVGPDGALYTGDWTTGIIYRITGG